jgi:hypothetical protein
VVVQLLRRSFLQEVLLLLRRQYPKAVCKRQRSSLSREASAQPNRTGTPLSNGPRRAGSEDCRGGGWGLRGLLFSSRNNERALVCCMCASVAVHEGKALRRHDAFQPIPKTFEIVTFEAEFLAQVAYFLLDLSFDLLEVVDHLCGIKHEITYRHCRFRLRAIHEIDKTHEQVGSIAMDPHNDAAGTDLVLWCVCDGDDQAVSFIRGKKNFSICKLWFARRE